MSRWKQQAGKMKRVEENRVVQDRGEADSRILSQIVWVTKKLAETNDPFIH